jgi:hypothetical protein
MVCLAKLLGDAETDVAGGTDNEDFDHCGMCVCVWAGVGFMFGVVVEA